MKERPRILITNDDGVHAPGIFHLWQALAPQCDIVICAPAIEQSGVGLAITIRTPLRVERVGWPQETEAWSVTGTPADCIKMALHKIFQAPPDLIVSGINRGSNAGRNAMYSGTVAGALEGALRNIPGIAFSCLDYTQPDFAQAAAYVPAIVQKVLENPLSTGTVLNVNFPTLIGREPKGFKLTRQGREYWAEDPTERQHPGEGHSYFWLGSRLARFDEHEDSDIAWLREGYITGVPLQVNDITDHDALKRHQQHYNVDLAIQTRTSS